MPIGFSCDDCGVCDECQGIVWPAHDGPPLTKEQMRDILKKATLLGKAARETVERIMEEVFDERA